MRLVIPERDLDALIVAILDSLEDNHAETLDMGASVEDREESAQDMLALFRTLRKIDIEHPVLREPIKAGEAYDWEALWKRLDEEEPGDDGSDEAADDERRAKQREELDHAVAGSRKQSSVR